MQVTQYYLLEIQPSYGGMQRLAATKAPLRPKGEVVGQTVKRPNGQTVEWMNGRTDERSNG